MILNKFSSGEPLLANTSFFLACTQPANPFAALGASGSGAFSGGFNFGGLGSAQPALGAKPAGDEEGADGDDNEPAVEEECQVG